MLLPEDKLEAACRHLCIIRGKRPEDWQSVKDEVRQHLEVGAAIRYVVRDLMEA